MCSQFEVIGKLVQFLLGLLLGVTVLLLELAGELVALATDGRQVAVGQFAPLLLHLAGELFPVSCDLVPVHDWPPRKNLELEWTASRPPPRLKLEQMARHCETETGKTTG